jgi:hypothetical protein
MAATSMSKTANRGRGSKAANWAKMKKQHGYASGLELAVAKQLDAMGVSYQYEPDTLPYPKRVARASCVECGSTEVVATRKYTPDFRLANDTYIEVKGRFTGTDRAKMKAVRGAHLRVFRLLFGADNWCTKLKKQRYSDWATANGFAYAIKVVPKEWTA